MRNYDVILFDLDGTLTDSAPGILNSVRYACRKLGLPIPGEETLRRFLGPPLIASFRELMGLDAADADRAVSAFREYFPTKGLFENEVYPGVPALLADLKAAGKTVILATSKPELRADFAAKAAANGQLDYDFDKAVQAFCKRKYASDFSREMTRSAEIYWKEFL